MSRTPLFGWLRRMAAVAQAARDTGIPADEMRGIFDERRLSRRRMIAAMGGSAALAIAPGCARTVREGKATANRGDDPVVIVGAGIAGLTAAYRLREAGIPFRVYEAQGRIGGRMLSLRDHFADGQVCELGGELIDTGHTAIRALADELGITLDDLSTDDPKLSTDVWWHGGRAYHEADILREFVPILAGLERDVATLPDADITYAAPGGVEALDRMTVSEWLDRQDARGFLRDLIEVAYTTEMGLECDEQSALNLLTFLDGDGQHFKVFGESDERFHVRGGNDLIVQKLADRVADAVETGHALEAISQSADGMHVLTFRDGAASRVVRARQVVLALPFTMLRNVRVDLPLPASKQRAIAECRYGTNAKLMIGFDRRVWRDHGSNGSTFTDLPFQTTWETSRLQPGTSGILTNFTGGRHGVEIGRGTAREQADLATRQLEAVFPGVVAARGASKEARMHWPTNPWVMGSYLCYAPGQWTTLRGAFGERVGELYFAGEHCSFDNQGFMEGGCETGAAVAAEIAASRKLRRAA